MALGTPHPPTHAYPSTTTKDFRSSTVYQDGKGAKCWSKPQSLWRPTQSGPLSTEAPVQVIHT